MKPILFAVCSLMFISQSLRAQEVTLIAPGGMRCPIERLGPGFGRATGLTLNPTIGPGGATHRRVVQGDLFDVPVVQPPYQDVIASGHVDPASETPLATVALVVVIRKGDPAPDITSADGVKRMLLAAKAISYPDPAGGLGGTAGVSFDETQKRLGIFDQVQPKVKRLPGVALLQMLNRGDIDVAVTYASEITDPDVVVVGTLPREISTPTPLVGFVSAHAKAAGNARLLLKYLSSPDAAAAYRACAMQPAP
jgi:molybdate transport system substrate-binding protein